jgi:septal ring factor EnvC (AmiA/AmiB activator)
MPEISARDLRRLEALEGRLQKEREQRRTLAAERRDLRAAAAESMRRARGLENELRAREKTLAALIAENEGLAAALDELKADVERLQAAPLELRPELDACRKTLGDAESALASAQDQLGTVQAERDGLAESLRVARDQLDGKTMAPVVPAAEIAKLVNNLISEIGSRLPGLGVTEGEMRLRVGFGKVGRTSGFVIPSPESPPELRESLHELSVRFDRTVELPARNNP